MVHKLIERLLGKRENEPFLPLLQNGKTYNLYNLPKGFVIEGDVIITSSHLTELPDLSEVIVKGDFNCRYNDLTSLKGAPKEVWGDFNCSHNQLTSLEGAPQEVGGGFFCPYNQLTSLEGAPQKVGESFHCDHNKLVSLEGAPQKVGFSFDCSDNRLTSLKGAPQEVGQSFDCSDNQLTSLEDAPLRIGGNFDCRYNDLLQSLVGMPLLTGDTRVYCDKSLAQKYGFDNDVFLAKDLYDNPTYQNENKIYTLRQAGRLREKTMQENAPKIAKTQAAFEAWLKQNGKDTPGK